MRTIVSIVLVLIGLAVAIQLFGFVASILWTLLVGLVIGGLAAGLVKSKKMGPLTTALYGVAGSFLGKIAGGMLGLGWLLTLALSIVAAALLIGALRGR